MNRAHIALAAIAIAVAAGSARAQQPLSVGVRVDNDAFNFWKAPYKRPDEEYTSGVRAAMAFDGAAPWERWLHKKVAACASGGDTCATHEFSFGQDMYTGTLVPGDTAREPGTRPNAGWLYIQESSRVASKDRLDETSVTLGVTGPPALGEVMQHFFHELAPQYNRPINWGDQIPFEPGLILAYDRTQRVFVRGEGEFFGGDIEPHAGASLGNILTEARAGVRARAGFNLQHPWQLVPQLSDPVVTFFADATIRGVIRNEFLEGTLFRSSPHVTERPFVPEYSGGVSARWQRVTVLYSFDQVSSEYTSRADGHAWSRFSVEWRLER